MIEHLIATDVGNRGVSNFYLKLKHNNPNYFDNALSLIEKNKEKVLIVSAFPIPPLMIPETDGPPGALALALAIEEVGGKAIILTEDIVKDALKSFYKNIITEFPKDLNYSLLISIETPGRNKEGKYYSFSGLEVNVRPYDSLFIEGNKLGIPTIGIGDGGNEIGMGNLELSGKYYSVVKTTELIVAGVSNWGAYGLVAALSIMEGRNLLREFDEEEVVKALVNEGLIDGITKRRELSVDGIPLSFHKKFMELLNALIEIKIK